MALDVEEGLGAAPAGGAESRAQRRVAQQANHRGGKSRCVARRDEVPRLTIQHDLRNPSRSGGHDRTPHRHRLGERAPERLGSSRAVHKDIQRREDCGDVVPGAEEHHAIGETEVRSKPSQRFRVPRVPLRLVDRATRHEKARGRHDVTDLAGDAQKILVALPRGEMRDHPHEWTCGLKAELGADGSARGRGQEALEIDRVVHGYDRRTAVHPRAQGDRDRF